MLLFRVVTRLGTGSGSSASELRLEARKQFITILKEREIGPVLVEVDVVDYMSSCWYEAKLFLLKGVIRAMLQGCVRSDYMSASNLCVEGARPLITFVWASMLG